MEKGIITHSIQSIHLENGKPLEEVKQYLSMRYKMDIEESVLLKRLEKMIKEEKAVA